MRSEQSNSADFKIVVVEDNLLDFELMESALVAQFTCDVHLVMTKGQFEEALAGKKPDIIVSDSNVVGFDGFAALQLAGERCPEVPFVFCSGAPLKEPPREMNRTDFNWVPKESGFDGLVSFVKRVLVSKDSTES